MSDMLRQRWANLTDEQREAISARRRQILANRTEEEVATKVRRTKETLQNRSEEEKRRSTERRKRVWASFSATRMKEITSKRAATRAEWSAEKKARVSSQCSRNVHDQRLSSHAARWKEEADPQVYAASRDRARSGLLASSARKAEAAAVLLKAELEAGTRQLTAKQKDGLLQSYRKREEHRRTGSLTEHTPTADELARGFRAAFNPRVVAARRASAAIKRAQRQEEEATELARLLDEGGAAAIRLAKARSVMAAAAERERLRSEGHDPPHAPKSDALALRLERLMG